MGMGSCRKPDSLLKFKKLECAARKTRGIAIDPISRL